MGTTAIVEDVRPPFDFGGFGVSWKVVGEETGGRS